MTAKKKPAPEQRALTIPERAVVALGFNAETTKELVELAKKSEHIVEITNSDGYKQADSARKALKAARLAVTGRGKDVRDDATKFAKAVISEEKRLVDLVGPEEERLEALQKTYDDKIEAERQEAVEAEARRCSAHSIAIETIRRMADLPIDPTPAEVEAQLAKLTGIVVGQAFEEFEAQAHDAWNAAKFLLTQAHEYAVGRVAREEQARKDAAELEALRREKAERDAADRKREAEEKAARERAEAEQRGRDMAEAAAKRAAEVEKQPIIAAVVEGLKPETTYDYEVTAQAASSRVVVDLRAGEYPEDKGPFTGTAVIDSTPRYSCTEPGCPGNHTSKYIMCAGVAPTLKVETVPRLAPEFVDLVEFVEKEFLYTTAQAAEAIIRLARQAYNDMKRGA